MTIDIQQFTDGETDGNGYFDTLMRSVRGHLDIEYQKSRIRGPEYATVYLGAIEGAMNRALELLMKKELTEKQIELAAAQIVTETKQQEQITQQTSNLADEALNIPKQGLVLDKQALEVEARTALIAQQESNHAAEALNIPKQGLVLDGQKCKLDAEFDLIQQQVIKAAAETALVNQKKTTELAQINAAGVDTDSVVGRQKALYEAQTQGFYRDAEQKATKLLVDTWITRRTTDEGETANGINRLDDTSIGQAVQKLLAGINV